MPHPSNMRSQQSQRLYPTNVYVRIRPEAESGGHASSSTTTKRTQQKSLEGWSDASVTLSTQYLFSKGNAEYTFPKKVLGPDASQQETFETMKISSLVDQFIGIDNNDDDDDYEHNGDNSMNNKDAKFRGGRNVMFFAYGQTGSGKTHTMLGTDESLTTTVNNNNIDESLTFHDGWGIFPRVYVSTLQKIKQRQSQQQYQYSYMLSASAIQFYLCETHDLLDPSSSHAVKIDPDTHEVLGATVWDMNSTQDLLKFLNAVRTNRQTRSTKMNDGSSRSHAALILYLRQYVVETKDTTTCSKSSSSTTSTTSVENDGQRATHDGLYCQTSFTIVDLAGAERPTKTGETRFTSAEMILWEMSRDDTTEVPTGAQAYIVNWELSGLATEIQRATEAHRRRTNSIKNHKNANTGERRIIPQKYSPPKQLVTDAIQFVSACLSGKAITSLCLCLSRANVNGWETWFSLQWGQSVSKLCIPVEKQYASNFEKAYSKAKEENTKAKLELEKYEEKRKQQLLKNSSSSRQRQNNNKYYETRKFRLQIAGKKTKDFEKMKQLFSASSPSV